MSVATVVKSNIEDHIDQVSILPDDNAQNLVVTLFLLNQSLEKIQDYMNGQPEN